MKQFSVFTFRATLEDGSKVDLGYFPVYPTCHACMRFFGDQPGMELYYTGKTQDASGYKEIETTEFREEVVWSLEPDIFWMSIFLNIRGESCPVEVGFTRSNEIAFLISTNSEGIVDVHSMVKDPYAIYDEAQHGRIGFRPVNIYVDSVDEAIQKCEELYSVYTALGLPEQILHDEFYFNRFVNSVLPFVVGYSEEKAKEVSAYVARNPKYTFLANIRYHSQPVNVFSFGVDGAKEQYKDYRHVSLAYGWNELSIA